MIQSDRAFKQFDPTERLYCCIATAVIGGAALSGAASIYGANSAANAQYGAAQAAIGNQNAMYAKNAAVLNPFIQAGTSQIPNQQALLDPNNTSGPLNALNALTGAGPNGAAGESTALAQTPGYQFSLTQGLNSTNNALAARGLGGSGGAVAKGAANYSEGLAGNTWQSVVAALQNQFNSQTGAGQNLINSGQGAAGALAGVGTNTANSITNSITGAGNASAAASNAIGSAVGGVGNSLGSAALLQQLTAGGGAGGIYTPAQIGAIGNMQASAATDAQANAYGLAQGYG